MNEQETYRGPGWWLPDPRESRNPARPKFFAGWVIRCAVLMSVCFGGLMFTEADLTFWGAFWATGMFVFGSGALLTVIIAIVWSEIYR